LSSEAESGTMPSLSWQQVRAFRLRRHHLVPRAAPSSLVAVVRDVCGVQAQVMAAAEMALWARIENLKPQSVQAALEQERTLTKIWCMRGAVHLLPATDLALYVGALGTSRLREHQQWLAKGGLPIQEVTEMSAAVLKALEGGPLTRKELGDRVTEQVGLLARPWIEHGWGAFVKHLSYEGRLCFGPNRGREVTFARLDLWLRDFVRLPVEEAQMSLIQRYLQGYGPATPQDFAAWSGLPMQEVNPVWQRLNDELVSVSVEGKKAWLLHKDLDEVEAQPQEGEERVQLLPSFDVFLLSHRDKSHLVDAVHYKRVYRKAGWLSPVVLVGGRVAGVWSHQRRGRKLDLTIEFFGRGSRSLREAIEAKAADLGRFLGVSSSVVFS
jgi:hypothetical protein